MVVRGEVQGVGYRYTMRMVAREVADEVLFFDGGVIVERGAPKELFTRPKNERTRRFLDRILRPLDD